MSIQSSTRPESAERRLVIQPVVRVNVQLDLHGRVLAPNYLDNMPPRGHEVVLAIARVEYSPVVPFAVELMKRPKPDGPPIPLDVVTELDQIGVVLASGYVLEVGVGV